MSSLPTLYLNENVSVSLLRELSLFQINAIHTNDVNNRSTTDEFQLEYAAQKKYILVSHNRKHFRDLHRLWVEAGKIHYGIIVMSPDRNTKNTAFRIKLFFDQKFPSLTIPFCEVPPKLWDR